MIDVALPSTVNRLIPALSSSRAQRQAGGTATSYDVYTIALMTFVDDRRCECVRDVKSRELQGAVTGEDQSNACSDIVERLVRFQGPPCLLPRGEMARGECSCRPQPTPLTQTAAERLLAPYEESAFADLRYRRLWQMFETASTGLGIDRRRCGFPGEKLRSHPEWPHVRHHRAAISRSSHDARGDRQGDRPGICGAFRRACRSPPPVVDGRCLTHRPPTQYAE